MDADLRQGALNLLTNCAGITPGIRLAVVHEDPSLGWYDEAAPMTVAEVANDLGAIVTLVPVGGPANTPNEDAVAAVENNECTVFFSRIGDQDRFEAAPTGKTVVMSYARTAESLASTYGRTNHQACLEMKDALNDVLFSAETVRITCPLGTSVTGSAWRGDLSPDTDVGVRRFPMGVHQPLRADGFAGKIALARFLTPTGSKVYEPAFRKIETPALVEIESGRWRFAECHGSMEAIRDHHKTVGGVLGIDSETVDSWHAGFHPACAFEGPASRDPDLWSNTVFTSPRFLHFHTCGDGPPGEICWMVQDPTVEVDGVALWDAGVLRVYDFAQTVGCVTRWPELEPLYSSQPTPLQRLGGG